MTKPIPWFIANWKMHMLPHEAAEFMRTFLASFETGDAPQPDTGFAPPFITLDALKGLVPKNGPILLGAQNVHWEACGAHTGEISPLMLSSLGIDFAIVGHSERRQMYGENNEHVALRGKAAIEHGLSGIVCIGETKEQYERGESIEVVKSQLSPVLAALPTEFSSKLIIAYEPVWAIGTGLAATPEQAREVHGLIREELRKKFGAAAGDSIRILYGGSTKPDNVGELLAQPNVNGALVGGASLKPDIFNQLIVAGRQSYWSA